MLSINGVKYNTYADYNRVVKIKLDNGYSLILYFNDKEIERFPYISAEEMLNYVVDGDFETEVSTEQEIKQLRADLDYALIMGGLI